ncbi:hypothetical protein BDR07DRAFT_1300222, partial [Suillus spraguei]
LNRFAMRSWRFFGAYNDGLDGAQAAWAVQQFSSTKYKSHRHIPETVAHLFD